MLRGSGRRSPFPPRVARQDKMLRGVMIHNYRMAKTLG
jgi:hypothetical protein